MTRFDCFFAHDVDRTLLDTQRAADHLYSACEQLGIISVAAIKSAQQQVQASAGSFDVMSYIADQGVDEAGMSDVYTKFIRIARKDNMLYDDALPLLAATAGRSALVTYGGAAWQQAKIEAAGLADLPRIITPFKHKGELITSWGQDGGYDVTTDNGFHLSGRSVTLVDDKAASFNGLPSDCRGFWLVRGKELLASQAGDVPANVDRISSLSQINVALIS